MAAAEIESARAEWGVCARASHRGASSFPLAPVSGLVAAVGGGGGRASGGEEGGPRARPWRKSPLLVATGGADNVADRDFGEDFSLL